MTKKKWNREDITPEVLRELLHLDEETGKLYWKERGPEWFSPKKNRWGGIMSTDECAKAWNSAFCGKEAGTENSRGYKYISILGVKFLCSRIEVVMKEGKAIPEGYIIHNGNPVSREYFEKVVRPRKNTGRFFRGVNNDIRGDYWYAQISLNGKNKNLGTFKTPIEAARAYDAMAYELYGKHARLNFPEDYGLTDTKTDDIPEGYFD